MKHCFSLAVFVVLMGGFWRATPQVSQSAKPTVSATEASRQGLVAPANERATAVLVDGDAAEEIIKNRANGQPIITHTRVFDLGQVREVAGRDDAMQREHATLDLTGEVLTITGTYQGLTTTEDVRFLEGDGVLHVIRDLYPNPDDTGLYSGRNLPITLESTPNQEGTTPPQVHSATTLLTRNLTTTPSPQVSTIGGVSNDSAGILNGRVHMSCGKTWNGTLVVNDQDNAYPWYISGTNFGTATGTVTLAGRTARIIQWTPTQIIAAPTASYTWGPLTTLLTVRTATGATTSSGVGIAPAIRTRIYGQCTWYVAYTRLNMGKQPSPYAYSGYSTITAQYAPQVGDQYEWNTAHTAIVIQVSGPVLTSGGYQTWTLQIGEYNAQCTNAFDSYTTQFQIRTTTTGTIITKYPQSSITSYGSATSYYR